MAVITEDAIRQLASFRSSDGPVVTCYLDVDGRRMAVRQSYEQELDRLLRSVRDKVNGAGVPTADLRRIEEYVKGGFDRSRTRGLAIFSCAASGLWEVMSLPVSVHNRIVVNSSPAVAQLEAIVQELDRFGVLLVDKQRARVFVFEFGELVDRSELLEELPRDYDTRGEKDQGYDRERHHVDELAAQHLRHAAAVAFHLYREHGFEHLTIGAPDELVSTVESMLHPYLRDRLGPRIAVGVNAGLDEIRSAAIEVDTEVERRKEVALVHRLRDAVGAGSRGVSGLDATLEAIAERRVDILFVSRGYADTGWRCESCGRLCHKGPTCPIDGEEMTHLDDVVEEAIDVVLAQSCRVELCADNADLDVLGRIGALLRY